METNFPVFLQTTKRDIRVTRRKISSFARLFNKSVWKFANALLSRYVERHWLESFNIFVLRQSRLGVSIQHEHKQQHIHINPHLSLTVMAWRSHSKQSGSSLGIVSRRQPRLQQDLQLIHTVTVKRQSQQVEQIMDEIIMNKRRVEIDPAPSLGFPSAAMQILAARRVVRHAVPSKSDQTRIESTEVKKIEQKPPEQRAITDSYRSLETPIDLNRLTDQIIQTIDHRIIAQRERLGKV